MITHQLHQHLSTLSIMNCLFALVENVDERYRTNCEPYGKQSNMYTTAMITTKSWFYTSSRAVNGKVSPFDHWIDAAKEFKWSDNLLLFVNLMILVGSSSPFWALDLDDISTLQIVARLFETWLVGVDIMTNDNDLACLSSSIKPI